MVDVVLAVVMNWEWLILNMAGLEREEFRVLYLNNQNQLIAGETPGSRFRNVWGMARQYQLGGTCLLYTSPGERSLILRALKTLDRHLHEPGEMCIRDSLQPVRNLLITLQEKLATPAGQQVAQPLQQTGDTRELLDILRCV